MWDTGPGTGWHRGSTVLGTLYMMHRGLDIGKGAGTLILLSVLSVFHDVFVFKFVARLLQVPWLSFAFSSHPPP